MAHMIGKNDSAMFGSRTPAWHKLGKVVDGQPDIKQAIQDSGLGWGVELEGIYGRDNVLIKDHKVVVRTDLTGSDRYLGVVGKKYVPITNLESFDIVNDLCDSGAKIETCGSLKNGRTVWVMAVLPQTLMVKDDKVQEYLLLSTSHDGSKPLSVGITPIRVVCYNTLKAALRGATSHTLTVRHTVSSVDKVRQAAKILAQSREYFTQANEHFKRWADAKVDAQFAAGYLRALYGPPIAGDDGESKDRRAVTETIRRIGTQPGANSEAVKGTAYGLYNAVCDWLDYGKTKDDAKRLESTWFGGASRTRTQAANLMDRFLKMDVSDIAKLHELANVE